MKAEHVLLGAGVAVVVIVGISYLIKALESSKTSTDLQDNDLPDERGRGDRESTIPVRAILNDPVSSESCIARAHNLFNNGRGSDALRVLDDVISRDPDNVKPYVALGIMLHKRCCPEDALVSYKRAIALDPTAAEAHAGKGHILFNRAFYDETCDSPALYKEAYASLACARAFGSNDAKMYHYLGLTLVFLARLHPRLSTVIRKRAIKSFRRALDIDRHHPDTQGCLDYVRKHLNDVA